MDFDPDSVPEIQPPPAVVVEAPERSAFGQRELMLTAAALIGSGAITIGMMSTREPAPKATETVAVSPATVTAKAPAVVTKPSAGWTDNTAAWTSAGRKRVAFELAARADVNVWMRSTRPLLVVRCVQGRTEAFVFTDSPAAMESKDEDHTVRISFDGGDGRTERWPDSSAHDALFAPDGRALVAELSQARTLRFGFTPHNAATVVAHFDVAGLREKIGSAPACRQP